MSVRPLTAALVACSLALASCGEHQPPVTFTPQELNAALLTAGDLGSGWEETQRTTFTTRPPESPSIDPSLWCPAASVVAPSLLDLVGQSGADVEASRAVGSQGERLLLRQQAFSHDNVARYVSTVREAVAQCAGTTWTSEGTTYTIEPATEVGAGDDGLVWSQPVTVAGGKALLRQAVVRYGATGMILGLAEFGIVDPTTFDAAWTDALRKATTKLDTLTRA